MLPDGVGVVPGSSYSFLCAGLEYAETGLRFAIA